MSTSNHPMPSEQRSSKLVTVAQMQRLEAAADAGGYASYAAMMESAGEAVAHNIMRRWPTSAAASDQPKVLILVGPGNNGGDGLVCARQLHLAGYAVSVYLWWKMFEPAASYARFYIEAKDLDIDIVHIAGDKNFAQLDRWVAEADIVIDALLGTGNKRPIRRQLAYILELVQLERQRRILFQVAVDCPSGLYCDTGQVDPLTVAADLTVTFGYGKWGHHQFPGASILGDLVVADIGIPAALADELQAFLIEPAWLSQVAPTRDVNSHKGTFGKVMAAVGCANYPGAAFLSCAAAGRVGAGLITGAVPSAIWPIVAGRLAEPTWLPSPDANRSHLNEAAAAPIAAAVGGYTAFLLGCGLGQTPDTLAFIETMLQCAELPPTLIDADGLNLLSQLDGWPQRLPPKTILTPHVREMARLCQLPTDEVSQNRWTLAREKAAEWDVVLLVKGPYTVIAAPDGALAVLPIATPALATAGTGDVLAGTIIGLMAQGVEPFEAACLGAWVHGKAGERCGEEIGLAGVIASDLLPRLPQELRLL